MARTRTPCPGTANLPSALTRLRFVQLVAAIMLNLLAAVNAVQIDPSNATPPEALSRIGVFFFTEGIFEFVRVGYNRILVGAERSRQ
jgi:hypothetical protein